MQQQAQLDRVTSQAKRMGCDSSGFFSLFNGQSAQCGPVNNQIQQMRGNLDQITTSLERLRSGGLGGADRENQRRSVMTALAQNNCGPQYAAAAREQSQGPAVSSAVCSATIPSRRPAAISAAVRNLPHRLRTHLRRRLFPGLVRHRPGAFSRRRQDLQAALPGGGGHSLHLPQSRRGHEPGGVDQRPALFRLPNAFKFRTEFNPSCSCKAAGQTWSDALKSVDDKAAADSRATSSSPKRAPRRCSSRRCSRSRRAHRAAAKKGAAPAAPRPQHAARRRAASRTAGRLRLRPTRTSRSARWVRPSSAEQSDDARR